MGSQRVGHNLAIDQQQQQISFDIKNKSTLHWLLAKTGKKKKDGFEERKRMGLKKNSLICENFPSSVLQLDS